MASTAKRDTKHDEFISAVEDGDVFAVKGFLKGGIFASPVDPNYIDHHGKSALMIASANGNVEIVNDLITNGVKVDLPSQHKDRWTALFFAAVCGHSSVVRSLLAAGASPNARDADDATPLMMACSTVKPNVPLVEWLLRYGAEVDAADKDGCTALMMCARNGALDLANLLLRWHANPNLHDKDGVTALMYAAGRGRPDVLDLLIRSGAELDAQDKDGWTALIEAARNGKADCASLLIKAGAKVQTLKDGRRKMSALDHATTPDVREAIAKGLRPGFQSEPPDILKYPPIPASSRLKPDSQLKNRTPSPNVGGKEPPKLNGLGRSSPTMSGGSSSPTVKPVSSPPIRIPNGRSESAVVKGTTSATPLSSLAQFEASARAAAAAAAAQSERSDDESDNESTDSPGAIRSLTGTTHAHSMPNSTDQERARLLLMRTPSAPGASKAAPHESGSSSSQSARKQSRSGCGIWADDSAAKPAGKTIAATSSANAPAQSSHTLGEAGERKGALIPKHSIPESQHASMADMHQFRDDVVAAGIASGVVAGVAASAAIGVAATAQVALRFAPVFSSIYLVIQSITTQVNHAIANKDNCRFLAMRCLALQAVLQDIEKAFNPTRHNVEVLGLLVEEFEHTLELVTRYTQASFLRKFISASSLKEEFVTQDQRLTALMGDLATGMQAKTIQTLNSHLPYIEMHLDAVRAEIIGFRGEINSDIKELKDLVKQALQQNGDPGRQLAGDRGVRSSSTRVLQLAQTLVSDELDAREVEQLFAYCTRRNRIGKGSFGTVYKAMFRGAPVAVKELDISGEEAERPMSPRNDRNRGSALSPSHSAQSLDRNVSNGSDASNSRSRNPRDNDDDDGGVAKLVDDFKVEVAVLRSLRSSRLVQFVGACTKPPNLMIVTEYLPNGSLYQYLKRAYAKTARHGRHHKHDASSKNSQSKGTNSRSLFSRLVSGRSKSAPAKKKKGGKPIKHRGDASESDENDEKHSDDKSGDSDDDHAGDDDDDQKSENEDSAAEAADVMDDIEPQAIVPAAAAHRSDVKEPPLTDAVKLRLCLEIAFGLSFLHQHVPAIVHRDLKSRNVLMDEFWNAKICDFGLSRTMTHTAISTAQGTVGTPQYMSPEALRAEPVSTKSDVYSYGILMYEIWTGVIPWEQLGLAQVVTKVLVEKATVDIPSTVPSAVANVIRLCLTHDPAQRPDIAAVLRLLKKIKV